MKSDLNFSKVRPNLSIVVPVFNEASNITENINLLKSELAKNFNSYEVIIISDGSTDSTNEIVSQLKDVQTSVICLKKNQGKGAAIRIGFERCRGDYILFIDGGMELHPKEIKIFMGLMSLYSADMIVGSKRHPQSTVYYPWYRRLLSYLFQKFVQLLFSVKISDTQVGIKLFRTEVIKKILPFLKINHYGFDLEIICLASVFGYDNILEAPIRLDYFLKNRRSVVRDVLHTVRVGRLLLIDTIKLYFTIRKIRINKISLTSNKI
jgi:glycosyltransferase involved in cell wall biosynthesis